MQEDATKNPGQESSIEEQIKEALKEIEELVQKRIIVVFSFDV